jgi:uroporphyrinogen-III synthase
MIPTTLLLTRPRNSAQAFISSLDARALAVVEVVIAPLMEISATDAVVNLEAETAVIFTSANGVSHAPEGQGRTAYCVGAQTTFVANERGWLAQQAGETAVELIEALKIIRPDIPLVHLGGAHTRGSIARNLAQVGLETRHIALYTQRLLPFDAEAITALGGRCILPVFSPRTAEQLVREGHGQLRNAHIVALSPAVAAPLSGENTAQLIILPTPQAVYMQKAVENLCLTLSLP